MPKKYALLIGNSNYRHRELGRLTAPENDVLGLSGVLKDPEICAFDEVHLKLDASVVDVKSEIGWLLRDRHPEDLVLLYFSGHGVKDSLGTFFLALVETNPEDPDPGSIDEFWLRRSLEVCRSERQVVILDACYSGGAIPENLVSRDAGAGRVVSQDTILPKGRGRFIFTATTAGNHAFERDGQSVYTKLIVQGLRTGDVAPNSHEITVYDLHRYLKNQVVSSAPESMRPQLWCDATLEPEPLVIARNPRARFLIPDVVAEGLRSAKIDEIELAAYRVSDLVLQDEGYKNEANAALLRDVVAQSSSLPYRVGVRISQIIKEMEESRESSKVERKFDLLPDETGAPGSARSLPEPEAAIPRTEPVARPAARRAFSAPLISLAILSSAACVGIYGYLSYQLSVRTEHLAASADALPPHDRVELFRPVRDTRESPEALPDPAVFELLPLLQEAVAPEFLDTLRGREDVSLAVVTVQNGDPEVFQAASAQINDAYAPLIASISEVILENRDVIGGVTVVGHTDSVPVQRTNPFQSNQGLSQARAQAISELLLKNGVPADLVSYEGRGASEPIADNGTPEGRARNRRVEIVIRKRV